MAAWLLLDREHPLSKLRQLLTGKHCYPLLQGDDC
jgi:hypothetical protein